MNPYWKVIDASVIGTSHLERETPCQDICRHSTYNREEDVFLISAVADGAGSAIFGGEGAELVCDQFLSQVEAFLSDGKQLEDLDREFGEMWLEYVQQRINDLARASSSTSRDYACTFLGAVVSDEAGVFFQIGDGAIVFEPIDRPGRFFFAVIPNEGMYANTTNFITDTNAVSHLQCTYVSSSVSKLAIFTDGLQSLAIDYSDGAPGIPHAPFLKPMFAPLTPDANIEVMQEKLRTYLNSDSINTRTDDDKTLFLAVREVVDLPMNDGDIQEQ